jgi:uncharacterized protein YuzE
MKLSIDSEADALYLRLSDAPIVESETVRAGVVLDFDAEENVVGVELLNLSKRVAKEDLQKFLFENLGHQDRNI